MHFWYSKFKHKLKRLQIPQTLRTKNFTYTKKILRTRTQKILRTRRRRFIKSLLPEKRKENM